jgi:hypothetical protein
MGLISVQVGKMDVSKVPKEYAKTANTAMENAVKDAIKGDEALTDKKGEGYTIGLSVTGIKVEAKGVSCTLAGEIVRFPKREMLSTSIRNGAEANGGKPDALVKQCVGAAAEGMMKKIVPVLKAQARS